jgi:hypothetical protein
MKKKLLLTTFIFSLMAVATFATGVHYVYSKLTTGESLSYSGVQSFEENLSNHLSSDKNVKFGPMGAAVLKEIIAVNKSLDLKVSASKKSFAYRKKAIVTKKIIPTNNKVALKVYKHKPYFPQINKNKVLTDYVVNNSELISLNGFTMTTHMGEVNWTAYINDKLSRTKEMLAKTILEEENPKELVVKNAAKKIQNTKRDVKVSVKPKKAATDENVTSDKVSNVMAAQESVPVIDDELTFEENKKINELVNNLTTKDIKKIKKSNENNDDLMFIDYSELEEVSEVADINIEVKDNKKPILANKVKKDINNSQVNVDTNIKVMNNLNVNKKINQKPDYRKGKRDESFIPNLDMSTHEGSVVSSKVTTQKIANEDSFLQEASLVKSNYKNKPLDLEMNNPALMALKKDIKKFKKTDKVTHTTIKVTDALINKSISTQITDFELIPQYDRNERISDHGTGSIVINEKLNNEMSVVRGTVIAKNKVRTNVDITVEKGDYQIDIPLMDQELLNSFLDKKKLEGLNGFLLIDLDESIDSVDIDSSFEAKIFLTDNFKVTAEEEEYRYILYVGVEPGNALVHYLTLKDEVIQKIVHITEGEVYFEGTLILDSKVEKVELYETKLLGNSKMELNIEGSEIAYFNTDIKAKSIGLNLYQYKRPKMMLGMRKYLELKHLGESIYLGHWDKRKAEVPSRDYIEYIMNTLDIESLNTRCLIQVNLKKKMTDFLTSGETAKGAMNLEVAYLEKDGMFNDEVTDLTTKAYLVGDMQGVVSAKISYEDGTVDYLQSYCSEDTFLVEQL